MKKIYRSSQFKDIMGHRIGGLLMHKYGLPYRNGAGHIFPNDPDLVEMMLDAAERHSDVHVVTELKNGWCVNRYEPNNADAHYLFTGNADPEIEFSKEFSNDDFSDEEIAELERQNAEFRTREFTPVELAAISFAFDAVLNRKSKQQQ